jgi:CBS domain-containing membrane protein
MAEETMSLSLTGAFMIALKAVHPPAGATPLIVSLGIVTAVSRLIIIEAAVALLTVQAILINRRAGIDYPFWALRERS